MAKRNIKRIIQNTKVDRKYDLSFQEVVELVEIRNPFKLMSSAFVLGYAQGMKFAKSEMKKKGVLVYGK